MIESNFIDGTLHIYIKIGVNFIANCLIYLAGLLCELDLIPKLLKTLKTKNVEVISFSFNIICLTAYFIYVFCNIF